MGRILAIDYGKKRVGIAVTDPFQIIANGLTTITAHETISWLLKYVNAEKVDTIVVGEPRQLNNQESESMIYIKPFMVKLRKALPEMNIEVFDERFTSVLAHKAMLEGGLKKMKRQDKSLVDEISATILLQSYMEWKHNKSKQ